MAKIGMAGVRFHFAVAIAEVSLGMVSIMQFVSNICRSLAFAEGQGRFGLCIAYLLYVVLSGAGLVCAMDGLFKFRQMPKLSFYFSLLFLFVQIWLVLLPPVSRCACTSYWQYMGEIREWWLIALAILWTTCLGFRVKLEDLKAE